MKIGLIKVLNKFTRCLQDFGVVNKLSNIANKLDKKIGVINYGNIKRI